MIKEKHMLIPDKCMKCKHNGYVRFMKCPTCCKGITSGKK